MDGNVQRESNKLRVKPNIRCQYKNGGDEMEEECCRYLGKVQLSAASLCMTHPDNAIFGSSGVQRSSLDVLRRVEDHDRYCCRWEDNMSLSRHSVEEPSWRYNPFISWSTSVLLPVRVVS